MEDKYSIIGFLAGIIAGVIVVATALMVKRINSTLDNKQQKQIVEVSTPKYKSENDSLINVLLDSKIDDMLIRRNNIAENVDLFYPSYMFRFVRYRSEKFVKCGGLCVYLIDECGGVLFNIDTGEPLFSNREQISNSTYNRLINVMEGHLK